MIKERTKEKYIFHNRREEGKNEGNKQQAASNKQASHEEILVVYTFRPFVPSPILFSCSSFNPVNPDSDSFLACLLVLFPCFYRCEAL
ncbi:MAG: hypothetical protein LBL13_05330 [Bacteroidales bacterium]|jgi:hypothetical protein|nr:hypothetical protein [Bacteroidales bacterium]